MSNGPIEFLSDGEVREVPATEVGGADGLIQPEKPETLRGDPEASGGHVLSPEGDRQVMSEVSGIMRRDAMTPLSSRAGWTGEPDREEVIDPHTGRVIPPEMLTEGGEPGELSDLKPGG